MRQDMESSDILLIKVTEILRSAAEYSFKVRRDDGHWSGEVHANATFTAEYIFMRQALDLDLKADRGALCHWLLGNQNSDGSWGLAPQYPGDVSTTTEAYLALKIIELSPESPAMCRAREFMIKNGGVAKVGIYTRIWLATFGLMSWDAVPQLPMDLILMPSWSPINIYTLASWARTTLIPLLLVRHHQPTYALPNRVSSENDFLDELWCNPANKDIPYAASSWELLKQKDLVTFGFTMIDKLLFFFGGLRRFPMRNYVRQQLVNWIVQHQEASGDWAGYWPPMHGGVLALLLEGFSKDDSVIARGLEAMERFTITDEHGKRCQSTVSPVWDTALMTVALCDSGLFSGDQRLQKTVTWIKSLQHVKLKGDWRIYNPDLAPGGWSFEDFNTFYPDVDDTAVVVMALLKENTSSIDVPCITRATMWMLGMQNRDGGWGAFDHNNDQVFLEKSPFKDMGRLCDPSSTDVTGRLLECLGMLLTSPHRQLLASELLEALRASSRRAIAYILPRQEATGAWWGRWGVNYIYGTSNVLCGLANFAKTDQQLQSAVDRAVLWLESIRNADGGWGEGLDTYQDSQRSGHGESTASQTAWALMALLAYVPPTDEAVQKGIRYLLSSRIKHADNGSTWADRSYTATGFPLCLYLQYTLYPHYFPMMALGRYVKAVEALGSTCRDGSVSGA